VQTLYRFFMRIIFFIIAINFAISSPAFAAEKSRGDVFCYPAKGVVKMLDRMAQVKDQHRDIVNVTIAPRFLIKDGGLMAERLFLRDGNKEIEVPILPSGETPDFEKTLRTVPQSDICVTDPSRAHKSQYDEGLYFEMGLSPYFNDRDGSYTLTQLKEGVKDGTKHIKKMVPSAISMFIGTMNYIALTYEDRKTPAQITAIKGTQKWQIPLETYKDMHIFSFDKLEKKAIDRIEISGGPHKLSPTPSVKTLKRFSKGAEDENG